MFSTKLGNKLAIAGNGKLEIDPWYRFREHKGGTGTAEQDRWDSGGCDLSSESDADNKRTVPHTTLEEAESTRGTLPSSKPSPKLKTHQLTTKESESGLDSNKVTSQNELASREASTDSNMSELITNKLNKKSAKT